MALYVSARTDYAVRAMLAIAADHAAATGLRDVWVAVEVAIQGVVDNKTLAELSITIPTT
jgi:DNA-binding IscR family transcriptional regulator